MRHQQAQQFSPDLHPPTTESHISEKQDLPLWQLQPLPTASLEQELWPLEENDRLAAQVCMMVQTLTI